MKQFERTKTITYRWWTDGDINPAHIEALEESAEDRIFEMITRGFTSGELRNYIRMPADDSEGGVEYSGWWKVSIEAKED